LYIIANAEALRIIVYSSSFIDRIRTEEGGIAASTSSLDFASSPELADALHCLFHGGKWRDFFGTGSF
jgi:hypothetical protein